MVHAQRVRGNPTIKLSQDYLDATDQLLEELKWIIL